MFVRFLFVFDLLCILFMIALWPIVGKELSLGFSLVLFFFFCFFLFCFFCGIRLYRFLIIDFYVLVFRQKDCMKHHSACRDRNWITRHKYHKTCKTKNITQVFTDLKVKSTMFFFFLFCFFFFFLFFFFFCCCCFYFFFLGGGGGSGGMTCKMAHLLMDI